MEFVLVEVESKFHTASANENGQGKISNLLDKFNGL